MRPAESIEIAIPVRLRRAVGEIISDFNHRD